MAPFVTTSSLIITVSREFGSGGDEIATRTAEILGLRLIDRQRLREAAMAAGMPEFALEELTFEGERSLAGRIVQAMWNLPPLPAPTGRERATVTPGESARAEYALMVAQVIRELVRPGGVMLIGMGGQMLLANEPRSIHIRITAPFEMRVQAVRAREHITLLAARRKVKASDQARANYLRIYHQADFTDTRLYHLVINTALVSRAGAVAAIVGLARAFAADPGHPAAAPSIVEPVRVEPVRNE